MDNSYNDIICNLPQYNSLSTKELWKLLRLNLDTSTELRLDINVILFIAGLINVRGKDNPQHKKHTRSRQCLSKHYLPKFQCLSIKNNFFL